MSEPDKLESMMIKFGKGVLIFLFGTLLSLPILSLIFDGYYKRRNEFNLDNFKAKYNGHIIEKLPEDNYYIISTGTNLSQTVFLNTNNINEGDSVWKDECSEFANITTNSGKRQVINILTQ